MYFTKVIFWFWKNNTSISGNFPFFHTKYFWKNKDNAVLPFVLSCPAICCLWVSLNSFLQSFIHHYVQYKCNCFYNMTTIIFALHSKVRNIFYGKCIKRKIYVIFIYLDMNLLQEKISFWKLNINQKISRLI